MKGKSKTMAEKNKLEELSRLFGKTPEMQECVKTAGAINSQLDPGDTVPVKIDIPKQFIQLTEFLEQKRATAAGVKPRPAAKVLNQIILNELHDQLHWLVTSPAHYAYYRDLWNHFCDAHDAPEEKIPDPLLGEAKGVQEGPF
jgi:hypothetical protein